MFFLIFSTLQTVKHLRTLEFKPFVIFIKPPSIERLRETRKNAKIISSKDEKGAAKPFQVSIFCFPRNMEINLNFCTFKIWLSSNSPFQARSPNTCKTDFFSKKCVL